MRQQKVDRSALNSLRNYFSKGFTPYSGADRLLGLLWCGDTSFAGQINGAPAGAVVGYKNVVGNENSIDPMAATELGHLVLHNITRGNSATISDVNTGANQITLTANAPAGWANNDAIQCNSLVCNTGGSPYYFDLDCSGFLPANSLAAYVSMSVYDTAVNARGHIHPYETYASALVQGQDVQAAATYNNIGIIVSVHEQTVCIRVDASGAATFYYQLRCLGYWIP